MTSIKAGSKRNRDDYNGQLISFYEVDAKHVHFPHDDALVVTAQIDAYDVKKILVDSGSFANILFHATFREMKLREEYLKPIWSPLIDITGSTAEPLGMISLQVYFGKSPKKVNKMVDFLVVDISSAYNAIFKRSTLNAIRAVTKNFFFKMKFLTVSALWEVCGDQSTARSCYLAFLKGKNLAQPTLVIEGDITRVWN
ncbi:hypothetical protein CRG98_026058 [Punica granatum]|uniref:Uncharacterized protein n=1 Tax=Punica granatum TaxID=22663 RepID=A0A2I0JBW4_PUNGR|nr:hypothetical protein CRG98_026058 [Punica granatum]